MPRVVADQRERFDNDELFRKLSRDMEASMHRQLFWLSKRQCGRLFIYLFNTKFAQKYTL